MQIRKARANDCCKSLFFSINTYPYVTSAETLRPHSISYTAILLRGRSFCPIHMGSVQTASRHDRRVQRNTGLRILTPYFVAVLIAALTHQQ